MLQGAAQTGAQFYFIFAVLRTLIQKNSRRLELSISKNTLHGRWGQGPGSEDPRFPAGLPFLAPEILEFVAFRDSGKFSSNFPGTFPEFSSRTPKQTLETTTAFSSFLIDSKREKGYQNRASSLLEPRVFF